MKIHLVDDDPDVLTLLTKVLAEAGCIPLRALSKCVAGGRAARPDLGGTANPV